MGLPTRVVVPIVLAFAAVFLGIMTYLLHIGLGTAGSALGPSAPAEQGDARIAATAAPVAGPRNGVLPGAQVGGGPPAPVVALLGNLNARVAKNPRDADALVQLGRLYGDAGKYDRAATYFERALAVNPKLPDALFGDAAASQALGRRTAAVTRYRQFLDAAPSDPRANDARAALRALGA